MEKIEVKEKRSLQSSKNFATAQQMDQVSTKTNKQTKTSKQEWELIWLTVGDESFPRAERPSKECFVHDERSKTGDEPIPQSGNTSEIPRKHWRRENRTNEYKAMHRRFLVRSLESSDLQLPETQLSLGLKVITTSHHHHHYLAGLIPTKFPSFVWSFRFDEGEWVDIQARGQFGNAPDFFARDMAVYDHDYKLSSSL